MRVSSATVRAPIFCIRLPRCILTVTLAERQLAGNLLVAQTGGDKAQHLRFARCQRCQAGLQNRQAVLNLPLVAHLIKRHRHRVEQILVTERLGQEIDRARFHGAHRHLDVAMRRHEDHRRADILLQQPRLEFQSADTGEPDIDNETTHGCSAAVFDQPVGARVEAGFQPDGVQKGGQRVAQRRVAIDHRDVGGPFGAGKPGRRNLTERRARGAVGNQAALAQSRLDALRAHRSPLPRCPIALRAGVAFSAAGTLAPPIRRAAERQAK